MSAEIVVYNLLKNHAPLVSVVPVAKIFPGLIPLSTVLPAIAYSHVSSFERTTLGMSKAQVVVTSRIQVTVMTKTYTEQKNIMKLIRDACNYKQGTIAGIYVNSVIRDAAGPDLRDDDAGIYYQSIDFKVSFIEPN